MPLYEYRCEKCQRLQIEIRLVAEREQKPLPECWNCKNEMVFQIGGPVYANVKNPAAGGRS